MRPGLALLGAVVACASCARGPSGNASARPSSAGSTVTVGSTMFDDRYHGPAPSPWTAPAVAQETKGAPVEEDHDGVVVVTSRR